MLGERLRLAREELQRAKGEKLNQAAFAREIGIAPSSLHDLESGQSSAPAAETLLAIRDQGISPDYIVRGKGPKLDRRKYGLHPIMTIMSDLDHAEQQVLVDMAKALLRKKPRRSGAEVIKLSDRKGQ